MSSIVFFGTPATYPPRRAICRSASASCGTYPFTDSSIAGKQIKIIHTQELRAALNEGVSIILDAPKSLTNPATAGTPVKALDMAEIRSGVK